MHKQKINPSQFSTCKVRVRTAFTLVELIVVITILAILGTIAFISLNWYSTQARDTTRLSDLWVMKSALELFYLDSWKFPLPTNTVNITYSWATVWNQGLFWENVYANLKRIDKIPKDPLTDKYYTYSVTTNSNEYQIAWLLESNELWLIQNNYVNAEQITANAIVVWNFNGQITKSISWSICNILATPSIISSEIDDSTDLQSIVNSWSLVYNWYKNLPSSLKWSKFKQKWWFDYYPNNLLTYTDTNLCNELINVNNYESRVSLIKWIKDAYSWTVLKDNWEIKKLLSLDLNEYTPDKNIILYSAQYVSKNLWWNLLSINESVKNLIPDCTSSWQILTSSSSYDWCNANNIIVCSWLWTWYEISSCNIWTTISWTWASSYWYLFQWWRNKSFLNSDTSQQSTIIDWTEWLNSLTDEFWFVWNTSFVNPYPWSSTDITNNWWHISNTYISRKWPCAEWYHVPSNKEWVWLMTAGWWYVWSWNNVMNELKLPKAWFRSWFNWSFGFAGSSWQYWSSTVKDTTTLNAYILRFNTASVKKSWSDFYSWWSSIRCFKDL